MTRLLLTAERQRRAAALGSMPTRWTDPQRQFLESPYRHTILRGANGLGKSVVLACGVEMALAGELPWQRDRRGPWEVILAGNTWAQLSSTIGYLWKGRLPGWLKPGIRFAAGRMQGQRTAIFDLERGPDGVRGGQLRLGIFNAENLAGPRAHAVFSDEPLPEKVYNELWARLNARAGRIYQVFTTTAGTAHKMDYLWTMVDDPKLPFVGEVVAELTVENVTPRGGLFEVPFMSAREIAEFEAGLSQVEADMRMGRTRYPRSDVNWYSPWGEHLVRDVPMLPDLEGWRLGVGIDYGVKPGTQRAFLMAAKGYEPYARVHFIDEYAPAGRTTTREDAAGIRDMLGRHGVALEHVDCWVGDRSHPGDNRSGKKSNLLLRRELARLMGIDVKATGWSAELPTALRRLRTPRKYDQSVYESAAIVLGQMVEERFTASSRCVHLSEALHNWNGTLRADDPWKHNIDGMHYIVVPMTAGAAL